MALAQDTLSGKYEGTVKGAAGDEKVSLELKNDGGKISGRLMKGETAIDISEGALTAAKLFLKLGAAAKDGTINATLIQQPFEMGYRTAAWLDKLTRSNSAAIPADKFVDVGTRLIDRSNLAEMKRQLAEWAK